MPVAAIIVVVAVAVAQIGLSIYQMQEQKKQAKKQEGLRKEQLALETKDRELRQEREKASLAREARAKRSKLLNSAAFLGVQFSSQAEGGSAAIEAARKREADFIDQIDVLADASDDTTRRQIEADSSAAQRNATIKGISGVLEGIGTGASAFAGGKGSFGGGGGTGSSLTTHGSGNIGGGSTAFG